MPGLANTRSERNARVSNVVVKMTALETQQAARITELERKLAGTRYIFWLRWRRPRAPCRWWHREKWMRTGAFAVSQGKDVQDAACKLALRLPQPESGEAWQLVDIMVYGLPHCDWL